MFLKHPLYVNIQSHTCTTKCVFCMINSYNIRNELCEGYFKTLHMWNGKKIDTNIFFILCIEIQGSNLDFSWFEFSLYNTILEKKKRYISYITIFPYGVRKMLRYMTGSSERKFEVLFL